MPKIRYICVDCGKESSLRYPSGFKVPRERYRCVSCGAKHRGEIEDYIDTYKCIDCGKEQTGFISNFNKSKEEYRCHDCACKHMAKDEAWLKNTTEANRKMVQTPEWKEANRKSIERTMSDPDYERKCKERGEALSKNPKWIESHDRAMKERSLDPEWKKWRIDENKRIAKNVESKEKRKQTMSTPDYRNKASVIAKENFKDQLVVANHMASMKRRSEDPEWRNMMSERNKNLFQNPIWYEKQLIHLTGEGYWYGNKSLIKWNYETKDYYCELWNENLKKRIDAAYGYRSIISGRDKFDNKGRALSRHHLYWQKKACCIWDKDVGGYYAWILNSGKWVKYYIKGDPNKFVLLTDEEHGIIKGNKEHDRIWWIQYLENLIEEREKEGKKCYLSKEEYEVYKVEHADIIEKYTNRKVYK